MIMTSLDVLRSGWWHHPLPASPASWKKRHVPHFCCLAKTSPGKCLRVGSAGPPQGCQARGSQRSPVFAAIACESSALVSPPVRFRFYQRLTVFVYQAQPITHGSPDDAPEITRSGYTQGLLTLRTNAEQSKPPYAGDVIRQCLLL